MTEYAPRASPNYNYYHPSTHHVSNLAGSSGVTYYYGNRQIQYPAGTSSYQMYSPAYVPSHGTGSTPMYMSNVPTTSLAYHLPSHRVATVPSQSRGLPQPSYYPSHHISRTPAQHPRLPITVDVPPMADTESQESVNDTTKMSEPIVPPPEGFPDVNDFDELMERYVKDLSPKKQDKALIHARRAANIKMVLIDKKTTSIESAQFRFWVKKMFQLLPSDPKIPDRKKKVCHEHKPVAIREKLYKILVKAHRACQHGGRDKTSAQVRRVYSWVPKELISRFVKLCPTCQIRRGTTRPSPPESEKSPEPYLDATSPDTASPHSRRDSLATKRSSLHSPLQMSSFSSTFHQQNRWMADIPMTQEPAACDGLPRGNMSTDMTQHGSTNFHRSYSQSNAFSTGSSAPYSPIGSSNGYRTSSSYNRYGTKQEHDYQY